MNFEITLDDIACLSDSSLRELIGRLAEREVARAGLSVVAVTYGGHQNAADGGIDVRVDLPRATQISDHLPRRQTGYQVKATTMPVSKVTAEMCPGDSLRPSIRTLAETGGAYVIVSSQDSVSDTALDNRRRAMIQAVADTPGSSNIHLDFYDGKRLVSWANQHPGLIPWIRSHAGSPLTGWQPFQDWSSSPSPVDAEYFLDEQARLVSPQTGEAVGQNVLDGLQKLRAILSSTGGIVRLVGLSGVGKTRFVQALFDERLGQDPLPPDLAVYADLADSPEPTPPDLLDRLIHLNHRCILIIDNCGAELHRKLSSKVKGVSANTSLITIEYDISDDEPEHTEIFRLEPASGTVLECILEKRYPDLASQEIRRITTFSEGNARVALALANTTQHGDSLATLRDSELITRLFRQKKTDNPALLKAALACSLVYSFDGETLEGESAELAVLAELAEQSPNDLYAHIAALRRRQLIQARSKWRALLPHALAHVLAKQALEDIPPTVIERKFTSSATPRRLTRSLTRRLGCLHDSHAAQLVAGKWLGNDGLLSRIENLSDFGIDLLTNLAPINPRFTLNAIRQAHERSEAFTKHDRYRLERLVGILRSLAYDPGLFEESITLIAGLARGRGRTSNQLNDPFRAFESLFAMQLSGTHATIRQRIEVLRSLASSTDCGDQELALTGLACLLQCHHFPAQHGHDFGARRRDFGYAPASKEDVRRWLLPAFELSRDFIEYGGIFPRRVKTIAAEKLTGIIAFTGLVDEVISFADSMARLDGWPEGWVSVRKAIRLAEQREQIEVATQLRPLVTRLEPASLTERIISYVSPSMGSSLDLAGIRANSMEDAEEASRQVDSVCRDIGRELAIDIELLRTHLPDLLFASSPRIGLVADAVAKHSSDPENAWEIIADDDIVQPFSESAHYLLAGYAAGLARSQPGLSSRYLDVALLSTTLQPYFVAMQIAAGMDEAGYQRMVAAAIRQSIPMHTFRALGTGRVCDVLTGSQLQKLLLTISKREDGLTIALDILHMRTYSHESHGVVIDKPTRDAARYLLDQVIFHNYDARETFAIGSIIRHCLQPSDAALAYRVALRLGQTAVAQSIYLRDQDELTATLVEKFPTALLDGFMDAAGEAGEDLSTLSWQLREEDFLNSPFNRMKEHDVLTWVTAAPAERVIHAAKLVPPFRTREDCDSLMWTPTALRLLREAPDPVPVLAVFRDWLVPNIWTGSLAPILNKRLRILTHLSEDHDPRIASWAYETIDYLNEEIADSRKREAARRHVQDERFE